MRILTLTNLYPPFYVGGYELRCAAITDSLRQRGHTVRVLTSDHGTDTQPAPTNQSHVDRSLRIHGYYGHPWLGLSQLQHLETHNNQTLRHTIAEFQPDIVHVWCMNGLSKSLCLTLQHLGIPTVYDVSDHWILRSLKADVWLDWWNRRSGSLASKAQRAAWSLLGHREKLQSVAPTNPVSDIRFKRLYFTSARLRELTAEQGYAVDHGSVIHCPVDTDHFSGTPVTCEPRNWLWVGRLAEDKGIHTALRALALLKDRFQGQLHVYGKGDAYYVAQLKQFAQEHALPISWHNATPDEMPAVYRAHDALLFTSEWEEPFALTPLEAMSCGLPVIGTMTGGSRELFRHGDNALTYEAGDPSALAEQILRLQADHELRRSITETGHHEVRQRFAMKPIVDQVEAFLSA
ncbi:MAG: glycosyltransferase family 4 protein [Verrucomicrobiaceae bacterium]|nr:glycosyltransferase family 4 protein [Verrucomicrobiaceae bacterium]